MRPAQRAPSPGSGRAKRHVDTHRVKGEDDFALVGLLQHARLEQCVHVAMNRFDVPIDPTCRLANRQRSRAGQRADQLPAFCGQQLEQQFRGSKR